MDYRKLYMKYKNKYLNLKNNLRGGDPISVIFIGTFSEGNKKFLGSVQYNNITHAGKNYEGYWISNEKSDPELKYSFIDSTSKTNDISHFIFNSLNKNIIWTDTDNDQKIASGSIVNMTDNEIMVHCIGILFNRNVQKSFISENIIYSYGVEQNIQTLTLEVNINTDILSDSAYYITSHTIEFINSDDKITVKNKDGIPIVEILKNNKDLILFLLNMLIIIIYKKKITILSEDIENINRMLSIEQKKLLASSLNPCIITIRR